MLLPIDNVLVDSETSVMTSRVFVSTIFEGAHIDKVCIREFIDDECVCVISVYVILYSLKKNLCPTM